MTSIIKYIKTGELSEDRVEAHWLQLRAVRHILINEHLYKWGFALPLLKCVTPEEGKEIMKDIHEGIYGNQKGGQSLAYKIIRQGYFWLTLKKDALAYVKSCLRCQIFAPTIKLAP